MTLISGEIQVVISHIIRSNLATMIHIFVRDLLEPKTIQVADGIDLHNGMAFWRGWTRKPACFRSLYSQKYIVVVWFV